LLSSEEEVDLKHLGMVYESTKSIEETCLEYVEDECLGDPRPDLNSFEIAVDAIKKWSLGSFDKRKECLKGKNDIEMVFQLWIAEERERGATRNDIMKKLDVLGEFILSEAKKRLRK